MQLPTVEKHARLALYTPFSAFISAIACGILTKLINASIMSFTVYFIANLRREPRAVFIFWSFILTLSLTMSSIFRTLAVLTRNTSMAMFLGCLLLVVFTACSGLPSPVRVTHDWLRWIGYIDPFGYTFEALMINEFSRRYFPCATDQTVPSGPSYDGDSFGNKVCSSQGSITGSANVSGDDYIQCAFGYISSHLWRNLAIIIAFFVFFTIIYLLISHKCYEQPFEVRSLVFRQTQHARSQTRTTKDVEERNEALLVDDRECLPEQEQTSFFQEQGPTFHWHDICYELKQKGETRRVLDHIDGWVKPGTCTAVMVSHC
jgi:ATP-binding cassette, subfamily G (WHITE), member 2, PDR